MLFPSLTLSAALFSFSASSAAICPPPALEACLDSEVLPLPPTCCHGSFRASGIAATDLVYSTTKSSGSFLSSSGDWQIEMKSILMGKHLLSSSLLLLCACASGLLPYWQPRSISRQLHQSSTVGYRKGRGEGRNRKTSSCFFFFSVLYSIV